MILLETHESVPHADVGALVQRCLAEGARHIYIAMNPDRVTCTVRVQRD